MKSLFAIHSEIRAEVGSLEEVLDKRKLPLLFYFGRRVEELLNIFSWHALERKNQNQQSREPFLAFCFA